MANCGVGPFNIAPVPGTVDYVVIAGDNINYTNNRIEITKPLPLAIAGILACELNKAVEKQVSVDWAQLRKGIDPTDRCDFGV